MWLRLGDLGGGLVGGGVGGIIKMTTNYNPNPNPSGLKHSIRESRDGQGPNGELTPRGQNDRPNRSPPDVAFECWTNSCEVKLCSKWMAPYLGDAVSQPALLYFASSLVCRTLTRNSHVPSRPEAPPHRRSDSVVRSIILWETVQSAGLVCEGMAGELVEVRGRVRVRGNPPPFKNTHAK